MSDIDALRQKIRSRIPQNAGRWFDVHNANGDKAVIRIYQEIGWFGITAEDFAIELDAITAPEIEVQINSPGGDVFDSIAIYNALRAHPARVTMRVDGIAASAASVIVQAGDHRVMLSASQVFIHEAWGLAVGSAEEMRAFADMLDKQSDVIAGIYANRSGESAEHFRSLMAAETWLTDAESVEAGLADEVVTPKRQQTENALDRRRLTDHLESVVADAESLTDRITQVVTLRAEQGKATDDSWRTREHVDRVAEALDALRGALTPVEDDTAEVEREYLRFLAAS